MSNASHVCAFLRLTGLLGADEKAGFKHLGEWAGEHGSEAWLEMELRL